MRYLKAAYNSRQLFYFEASRFILAKKGAKPLTSLTLQIRRFWSRRSYNYNPEPPLSLWMYVLGNMQAVRPQLPPPSALQSPPLHPSPV